MADPRQLVLAEAERRWPGDPRSQNYFTALAQQESGFNPAAHNTQGEDSYGLFQFGPDMRRAYGLGLNSGPEAQVAAAGDYLHNLYTKYAGDWGSVLAEHNLGSPRFTRMRTGGTDPAIERFRNNHLPAIEAIIQRNNMPQPPDINALVNQGQAPGGGIEELLAQMSPEQRAEYIKMLLVGLTNQSGVNPMQGNPLMAQQSTQPTQDPRVLAGMLSQGQGDQRGGLLANPAETINQLYPRGGERGGPQPGYLQWLGGSMQNPEPNARNLAIMGLVQNLMTGWQDARRQKQKEGQ
jgi:hypothetical protein